MSQTRRLADPSISREARLVGLRRSQPTLESVERRRIELWIITVLVLAVLAGTAVVATLWDRTAAPISPRIMRLALIGITLGFCAYALEKEMHLRRLSRLLVDERVLSVALEGRVHELASLLDAGRAVNSILDLQDVLDVILGSALDLLGGAGGSVMLLDDESGTFNTVSVRGRHHALGSSVAMGEGISGLVAERREPMLIQGRVSEEQIHGHKVGQDPPDSPMSVPLVCRETLLGVLNIAASGRAFTEYDLRAVGLFAEQAATAVSNSRLYEAERSYSARLVELDRHKNMLFSSLSHDLRTPLTSILGSTITLRNYNLSDKDRDDLLTSVERGSRRLAEMIDELLSVAYPQTMIGGEDVVAVLDVIGLIRTLAKEASAPTEPITVDGPAIMQLRIAPRTLTRVLERLITNAQTHGKPPIKITVRSQGGFVEIGVLDAGPGIPVDKRETIFEVFSKLDESRSTPGLGIGLPIARGVVDASGGTLRVEDSSMGGAAFWIRLPAVATADRSETHAPHAETG